MGIISLLKFFKMITEQMDFLTETDFNRKFATSLKQELREMAVRMVELQAAGEIDEMHQLSDAMKEAADVLAAVTIEIESN